MMESNRISDPQAFFYSPDALNEHACFRSALGNILLIYHSESCFFCMLDEGIKGKITEWLSSISTCS